MINPMDILYNLLLEKGEGILVGEMIVPLDMGFNKVKKSNQPLDQQKDPQDRSLKPDYHGQDDIFVDSLIERIMFHVHPFKGFKDGDQVIVWNQAYRYMTKLTQSLWIGSFSISFSIERDNYFLTSSNDIENLVPMHINFIKPYYPWIT
jgi:hypothetical protein